jgi:hypothetical protein
VLLTRSPLGTSRCCHRLALARLACVMHAASVHPEPGSNSPSETSTPGARPRRGGADEVRGSFSLEHHDPLGHGFDHPSRTDREDGRREGPSLLPLPAHLLSRCAIRNRPAVGHAGSMPAAPPRSDGVGTGFSHTVEFSRNVAGALRRLARGSRLGGRHQSGGDASTGLSSSSNLGQPMVPLWEYPVHRRHFRQKRRPSPCHRASGRPPQAVERGPEWPPATSCLPLSTSHRRQSFRLDDGLTLRTGVGHEALPYSGRKVAPPSKSCQPSKVPGTKAWQPFERCAADGAGRRAGRR